MTVTVQTPNSITVTAQLNSILNPVDFEDIMQRVAYSALESMRQSMQGHNRTGLTRDSLTTWGLEASPERVSVAVGSQSRGQILKWLDKGRGEVRPKNHKYLRWFTFPEHIAVFARYARATQGIELMEKAGADAMNEAPQIIQRTLSSSTAAPR